MPQATPHADSLLVEKRARRLTVFVGGRVWRTDSVSLGPHPEGDKQQEGDGRTPEGRFTIDRKVWASHYHHALHVSYPDAAHRARARALGVRPGGDIMIHGVPDAWAKSTGFNRLAADWTLGCIALGNREIDELWRMIPVGTRVRIAP